MVLGCVGEAVGEFCVIYVGTGGRARASLVNVADG